MEKKKTPHSHKPRGKFVNGHQHSTDVTADTGGHDSRDQGHERSGTGSVKRRNCEKEETTRSLIEIVHQRFPDLHNRTYFVPSVHFNRVTSNPVDIEGVQVKVVVPSKQPSDVRESEAHQRVHFSLQELFQEPGKALMTVWGLEFDTYLNNLGATEDTKSGLPSKAAKQPRMSKHEARNRPDIDVVKSGHRNASSSFVRPRDLAVELQRGTFDLLIISKDHGIVVCEIKATGDAFGLPTLGKSQVDETSIIRSKVRKALKQLEKEKKVLRRLTEDLDPHLRIRSALILPNMKRRTLQQALQQDPELEKAFVSCMEQMNLADALCRCTFSEQLPPIGRPWELYDEVTEALRTWWRNLVGNDGMQSRVYESLIARFCGPATPLRVNTSCRARVEAITLPDAVREVADCFQDWTLTADQVNLLRKNGEPLVYLTGPPGTGKTAMLILRALRWVRQGHDVYVISLWIGSEFVSRHIVQRIQEYLPSAKRSKVKLLTNTTGTFEDIISQLMQPQQGQTSHDDSRKGAGNQALATGSKTEISGDAQDVDMTCSSRGEVTPKEKWRGDNAVLRTTIEGGSAGNVDVSRSGDVAEMEVDSQGSLSEATTSTKDKAQKTPDQQQLAPTENKDSTKMKSPRYPVTSAAFSSSQAGTSANGLRLVCDEAPWFFPHFVQHLEKAMPLPQRDLHIWAASPFYGSRPQILKEVKLTQCLRCPPVVVRELEKGSAYSTRAMHRYATGDSGVLSGMPPPTDGPPIKWFPHRQHKTDIFSVWDCELCGEDVGTFLYEELKTGADESGSSQQQTLKYSDVIVSGYVNLTADVRTGPSHDEQHSRVHLSGFIRGLSKKVPYDVITKDDPHFAKKLVSPHKPNRVQVAEPQCILGLHWAVVVVIGADDMSATYPRYVDPWYDVVARCLSQLVVVGDAEMRLEDRLARQLVT